MNDHRRNGFKQRSELGLHHLLIEVRRIVGPSIARMDIDKGEFY
jgi:hypothetical protein